jgi:hypothetical protein
MGCIILFPYQERLEHPQVSLATACLASTKVPTGRDGPTYVSRPDVSRPSRALQSQRAHVWM